MANGKPGDHPLTDILAYGQEVYGREADELIRKIAPLCSARELDEWWQREIGWFQDRGAALEKARARYDELRTRAGASGWEASDERHAVDNKLLALILVATVLSVGHTLDHAVRDELRWLSTELVLFVVISVALYGAIGAGLYLYRKGKVGPRYWTIFALLAVCVGWAAHFSPFTAQPPDYIVRAYNFGTAGWLALGVLAALMLVMTIAGLYAAYLWLREEQARR
jgi:hypothetical protein